MNSKNDIKFYFKNNHLNDLINLFSLNEIVESFSFADGLSLAYKLLLNENWDQNLQEFSIKLLNKLRNVFPEIWNASWQYDALLGMACNITNKYEERYEAYKRAYDKAENPPPGLFIELARCCICPGSPPISYDDAIELVLRAIKNAPYADGIGLLSHIYSLKDDATNEEYWKNILKNSNQEFVSPPLEPKFLIEEYLREAKEKNNF
jgi:hypothetical protein